MDNNSALPPMSKIINKHKYIINKSPQLKKIINPDNIFVSHRSNKTIKEKLICNKLRSQQSQEVDTASVNAGCVKCDKCYLCRWYVKETKEFTSYHTNQVFRIKDNITCEDKYVIYLVDCDFLQVSYVGYTTVNMKSRFSNDKSHVKKNKCTCEKVTHLIKEKHDLDFSKVR